MCPPGGNIDLTCGKNPVLRPGFCRRSRVAELARSSSRASGDRLSARPLGWEDVAVRRLLIILSALGVAALVVTLALMVTRPVEMRGRTSISCGSVLSPVDPDPTAEFESGCSEVLRRRERETFVAAAIGGVLVGAVALAAVAQAAAARARTRFDDADVRRV